MLTGPLAVVPAWRWWTGFFTVAAFAGTMTAWAYLFGLPEFFRLHDKSIHFSTAGLLAFFLDGALRRRRLFADGPVAVPLAAALVLIPAGIEEFLQRYSAHRQSSIWDFAADVAGVLVLIPLSRRVAK